MIDEICDALFETVERNMMKANRKNEMKINRRLLYAALSVKDPHHVDLSPILSLQGMEYASALYVLALNRTIDYPSYKSFRNIVNTDSFRKTVTETIMNSEEAKIKDIALAGDPFQSDFA